MNDIEKGFYLGLIAALILVGDSLFLRFMFRELDKKDKVEFLNLIIGLALALAFMAGIMIAGGIYVGV